MRLRGTTARRLKPPCVRQPRAHRAWFLAGTAIRRADGSRRRRDNPL
ncbi:hypothetical protein CSC45_3049 [Pseudomonas aeruginosa]|nr:hypothetical protein CSC45_3049 [Pseudomonas aeruginosa]